MLTFHIITLFPEQLSQFCSHSIISRGIKAGVLAVKTYCPRDFCQDKYRKVDDTPYGGGAGMVLKPEPYYAAFEAIQRAENSPVLLMTPQGKTFQQDFAEILAKEEDITIICGHYEGFDERIRPLASHEVSLGDFVLTGGEIASMAIVDAVGRLVPGVLGKSISLAHESFVDGLLEGPQYTKPHVFRQMSVPEVLSSGNHKEIARWRRKESLKRTKARRPELLAKAKLTGEDLELMAELEEEERSGP